MGVRVVVGAAVLAAAIVAGGVAKASQAQTTPVDPGRIDERLRARPDVPDVSPVEVPALPQQVAAPESNLRVLLIDVAFEGATVVPLADLEAIAGPWLNRDMPLSEVFQLAEAVTAEYRRRGYVLARAVVAPQRIEDGVVVIQILEGYVDDVVIQGDAGGFATLLQGYMAPVQAGRPTRAEALERALLLTRDLRGIEVRAVLAPSATMPAAADLTLAVERQPVEAFVAVDNRGSRWLGPWQVYGGLSLNDLFGAAGRLSATGVVAPEDRELGFVSLSYDQPLDRRGTVGNVFVSHARTRPGDELRAVGLEGESTTWGLGLSHPFIRSRALNVIGRASYVARDAESSNDLVDPVFDDSLRVLSAELFANLAHVSGGVSSGRFSVTEGLDAFGATEDFDPDKSRATGTARFQRFNIELSHVQPLAGGLAVQLAGAAQVTSDSLLASEEFGIGGTAFGRAYDPSEITGDEGYAGKVEVFYTLPARTFGSVEPYVYYEGGEVRQNKLLPAERKSDRLESAGLGVRVGFRDRFTATLEYAKPLNRDVAAEGDRKSRVFFSLSAAF